MKLFELLSGIDILEKNTDLDVEISEITINSKEVQKGSLFIALCGVKLDGHDYLNEAVNNGAVCTVGEKDITDKKIPYIKVSSTRSAEAKIWMNLYKNPQKKIKVIGVTGTNGKTSITYMIKQILDDAGYKTALLGTIKSIIGDYEAESELTTSDPKKLAEFFSIACDKKVEYLIMEFSSHALEWNKIAGVENIEIGIFTNLTQDHLEFHKTMENYAEAKSRLFRLCKTGILNKDDKYIDNIIKNSTSKNYFYSTQNETCDFFAGNIKKFDVDGSEYELRYKNKSYEVTTPIAGKIYIYNSTAAAAAGILLGIDEKIIYGALKKVRVKGRLEKLPIDKPYSVFLDYAHTPDALFNITTCMNEFKKARLITVFGCGGDRDKTKRPEMGRIASVYSDYSIITSDNSRTENPEDIIADIKTGIDPAKENYTTIADRKKAIEYALEIAETGDMILIAGKGHEVYMKEKGETKYFNEREIVFDYLNNR